VTHLRKMMLEGLQRRNYSQSTTRAYVRVVRDGKPRSFGCSLRILAFSNVTTMAVVFRAALTKRTPSPETLRRAPEKARGRGLGQDGGHSGQSLRERLAPQYTR
jgi:hypothetical protein